jgi:hypothetical protein
VHEHAPASTASALVIIGRGERPLEVRKNHARVRRDCSPGARHARGRFNFFANATHKHTSAAAIPGHGLLRKMVYVSRQSGRNHPV